MSKYNEEVFNRELESISNAFVRWRYIYEIKGLRIINIAFINELLIIIEKICKEIVEAE